MIDKWTAYFMDVAARTAQLSYCERLKVGAVAVKNKRIILCGYNGTPAGSDNCCEEEDGYLTAEFGTGQRWVVTGTKTKLEVSHAERNLIEHAAAEGISLKGASLYITHAPCIECAKSIANSGFVKVVYGTNYKVDYGTQYLLKYGIEVMRYEIE